MKYVVIPDLHFRQYLCGVDLLETSFWTDIANTINGYIAPYGDARVIWLGDMFHRWSPTPREIVAARDFVRRVQCDLNNKDGFPKPRLRESFIVSGNHDYGRNRNNASELFGDLAQVIAEPKVIDDDGVALAFLPYPNKISGVWQEAASKHDANFQTSVGLSFIVEDMLDEAVRVSEQRALFSHVTFGGSEYSPGQPVPLTDVAVATSTFKDWTQVFGGHIHLPQEIGDSGNARYVGAVTPQNFGDDFDARIMVWDSEDNTIETFKIYHAAEFKTWTSEHSTLDSVDMDIDSKSWNYKPTLFHRWKFEVDTVEKLYRVRQEWDEAQLKGKFEVTVKRPDSDEPKRFEAAESTSLKDVFAAYVSARPDDIPADQRDKVLAIIQEVLP